MQKRALFILLIIFFLALALSLIFFFRYTGYSTSDAGQISLGVFGRGYCGDEICNNNETCSDCSSDCGICAVETPSGGGGGGGAAVLKKDFSISTSLIKVVLKRGESFRTSFVVKNTENSAQAFELGLSPSLNDLVFISENSFALKAGEEKIVYLDFLSSEKTKLGVYTGLLNVKTSDRTKEISIIYTIKSKTVLFDVILDIPAKYKEVLIGKEVLLQTTLFNLGDLGKTDVSIEYLIKDFEGNIIFQESETVSVETQAAFSKMVKLSPEVKPGDYVAIANAIYDGSFGSSNDIFRVVEKLEIPALFSYRIFLLTAFILFVLLILLILLFLRRERKKLKNIIKKQEVELKDINKKIISRKIISKKIGIKNFNSINENLSRKLSALEKAFSSGYISDESYALGRRRIEETRKRIKKKYL